MVYLMSITSLRLLFSNGIKLFNIIPNVDVTAIYNRSLHIFRLRRHLHICSRTINRKTSNASWCHKFNYFWNWNHVLVIACLSFQWLEKSCSSYRNYTRYFIFDIFAWTDRSIAMDHSFKLITFSLLNSPSLTWFKKFVLVIPVIISFFTLVESPRWLLNKNKEAEANKGGFLN